MPPTAPVYLNLATQITLIRIFLVPAMAVALLYGEHDLALLAFVAAAVSDAIDGFVARRLRQHTRLGAILDPLADKAIVLTAFILLGRESAPFVALPAWLIAVVIFRDALTVIGVAAMHLITGGVPWGALWIGKINTVLQMLTVVVAMLLNTTIEHTGVATAWLWWPLQALIWATLVATIAAAFLYSMRGIQMLSEQVEEQGPGDDRPGGA